MGLSSNNKFTLYTKFNNIVVLHVSFFTYFTIRSQIKRKRKTVFEFSNIYCRKCRENENNQSKQLIVIEIPKFFTQPKYKSKNTRSET